MLFPIWFNIDTHISEQGLTYTHTPSLISKITPFLTPPHHPLQIIDHMSCHTVVIGGGADKPNTVAASEQIPSLPDFLLPSETFLYLFMTRNAQE